MQDDKKRLTNDNIKTKVKFKKEIRKQENINISIKFIGITNKLFNSSELSKAIEVVFSSVYNEESFIYTISNITNFLRNFSFFKELGIKYEKEKHSVVLFYDNNEFKIYSHHFGHFYADRDKSEKNGYYFEYSESSGLLFNSFNLLTMQKVNDEMQIVEKIKKLQLLKELPIYLKLLCKMYYLFYETKPNLLDKDIRNKIQIMIFIINCYGISYEDCHDFINAPLIPYSTKLDYITKELLSYSFIEEKDTEFELKERFEEGIRKIKNDVSENLKGEFNAEKLMEFCNLIWEELYVKKGEWKKVLNLKYLR